REIVLDREMLPVRGFLLDLRDGRVRDWGVLEPVGITGTGTVAIVSQGIDAGLISLPRINTLDTELHLGANIIFTEEDLKEAGKAIGSVRAGHVTLCQEAGISIEDVATAYMSGASGTYVDALKARQLGMIPPRVKTIFQVGNTSLAMARDLVLDPKELETMSSLAKNLRQTHCMFAASKVFEKVYILELAYWTEGMPLSQYQSFLTRYGFPELVAIEGTPEVIRTVRRDIDDLGRLGLVTIPDIGQRVSIAFDDCAICLECVKVCPERALTVLEDAEVPTLELDQSLCNGVACRRCERACPQKGFKLESFFITQRRSRDSMR
ncbi:MAG: DUF4445 domain-containing protein, partial [Deltaproteobacteria bacterium]|nr:DUF4445 domain-containing protein [Deltaproteobacteria bacterium]